MSEERVLVTGGSGFIGAHVIARLLEQGWSVRTSVRDLAKADGVRANVRALGQEPSPLEFARADLTRDEGWDEALDGVAYLLHTASPFPSVQPKDESELIAPAREGTLRVLRAAARAGVKRAVVTSSFAAMGYGLPEKVFDESDWTNVDGADVSAYAKSKTLAERAAWDFVAGSDSGMELATVNPVAVFGPVVDAAHQSSSIEIVKQLLDGKLPFLPDLNFGVVDVRDVAELHLLAMVSPEAAGQRFLATAGPSMSLAEIAAVVQPFRGAGARSPRHAPDWLVRVLGVFNPQVRQFVSQLGLKKDVSSAKAQSVLGWSPRSAEVAVRASAESLVALRK